MVDFGAAATALHYPGQLTEIEVTGRGPSGRATAVLLHGTSGNVTPTGVAVASALGLPSTLFATGFGIDDPQLADATNPTKLPALTAASLGAVSVPLPVLADTTAPGPASTASADSAFVPPALAFDAPPENPRRTGRFAWELVVGLVLLGLSVAIAGVTWARARTAGETQPKRPET